MKTIFIIFFFLLISLVGCKKPDPSPELRDPIYQDLVNEVRDVASQIVSEQKNLDEHLKNLDLVKPQTGQIKYAEKRVSESRARLERLRQRKLYLDLRLETRKRLDGEKYLEAYHKDQAWPDPKEHEEYKAQKKLDQAGSVWDSKGRLEEYEQSLKLKNKAPAPSH